MDSGSRGEAQVLDTVRVEELVVFLELVPRYYDTIHWWASTYRYSQVLVRTLTSTPSEICSAELRQMELIVLHSRSIGLFNTITHCSR